jgi:predicted NAD/FAD-dependent oxidoreductase
VVVAVPAPQAVSLLEPVAPELAKQAASARMEPCWTVMATWDAPLGLPFAARESEHPLLAWAACEARKPGRAPVEAWVLQASAAWSLTHLEASPEDVISPLLGALAEVAGQPLPPPLRARAHRWRYARVTQPVGVDSLLDPGLGLSACGDWCRGNRVEDAWLSGRHAAQNLITNMEGAQSDAARPV